MIAKIVAGVFGVAVLALGAVAYHHHGGCCGEQPTVTATQSCPCDVPATPSCCQEPSRASFVSSGSCCADLPVSTIKGDHEVLAIEPREVK